MKHKEADTDPKGRHDAVLGDGLQETRRSCQTLQSCTAGGEEGANHDHPGRWPGQRTNHQVPVHPLPKPKGDGEEFSHSPRAVQLQTRRQVQNLWLVVWVGGGGGHRLTCL